MTANPSERRLLIGWILLAVLLGAMAVLTAQRPSESTDNAEPDYRLERSQMQFVLALRSMPGGAAAAQTSLPTLDAELKRSATKNMEAARLLAIVRAAEGRPLGPEGQLLRASSEERDRAYDQLATPKPDPRHLLTLSETDPSDRLMKLAVWQHLDRQEDAQRYVPWSRVAGYTIAVLALPLILLLSAWAWVFVLAQRASGRLKPVGLPDYPLTLADADRFAFRAAQVLSGYLLINLALAMTPLDFSPLVRAVLMLALVVLFFLGLFAIPVYGNAVGRSDIGLTTHNLGRNIGIGFLVFLLELPIAMLLGYLGTRLFQGVYQPSHPITQQLSFEGGWGPVVGVFLLAAVLAPLWEEVLFRGLLFPAIARVAGNVIFGAVASSFIFGAVHPQGIALVVALGTVGFFACLAAHYSGSLVPAIVMHALHNGTLLAMTLLLFG